MIKYKFYLSTGYRPFEVHPLYNDSLAIDYERENGEYFHRRKLNGKLTFVGKDFDAIVNEDIEFGRQYLVSLWISYDNGATFNNYWTGSFYRTDCEINYDDRVLSVEPTPEDDYGLVLGGINKEYNLLDLSPEQNAIEMYKHPLLQIYVPFDNVISCFLNGSIWEQDVVAPDEEEDLIDKYHFSLCNIIKEINLVPDTTPVLPNVAGVYSGTMNANSDRDNFEGKLFSETSDEYYIYTKCSQKDVGFYFEISVKRTSDDMTVYQYWTQSYPSWEEGEFRLTLLNIGKGSFKAHLKSYDIYARYICDTEEFSGVPTVAIPTDDIVENNRNYHYCIPYFSNLVTSSHRVSTEPTKWGRRDDGKYFVEPYSLYNAHFFPVGRSTWINVSLWYEYKLQEVVIEETEGKPMTLKVSYPLHSVIKVLLEQFAPFVHHEKSAEYSQILYGSNPIGFEQLNLFITPKSNVLNGDFQTPAQKAPITLGKIFEMLRNTFQIYWFIEDSKLKLEHIKYFKNGGSYSGLPEIGYDLTEMIHTRNAKPWSFGTSTIQYDKNEMTERYEFEWGDDVTDMFSGEPINITSKFAQTGNIETVNIADFNPDVGMMLLNPNAMNQDGFALFSAIYQGTKWILPHVTIPRYGLDIKVQNGYLAMRHIQQRYWVHDLPSWEAEINGSTALVLGIQKGKKQQVTFPTMEREPNINQLVKTNIGNGIIEKLSMNLSSRTIKADLEYDTY